MAQKIKFLTTGLTLILTVIINSVVLTGCSYKSAEAVDKITESYIESKSDYILNDGHFYLNGNADNCYFVIENGYIQFIVGDEKQMRELFDVTSNNIENFSSVFKFDEWCIQLGNEWEKPKQYSILYDEVFNKFDVAWNITYDSNGDVVAYLTADYVDENNFDSNGCRFTRIMTE